MNKSYETSHTMHQSDKRDYFSYLEDTFTNYVGRAKVFLDTRQFNANFNELKIQSISNLEQAIKLTLAETFEVTRQDLIKMRDMIRKSDFAKRGDIDNLCALYAEIENKIAHQTL